MAWVSSDGPEKGVVLDQDPWPVGGYEAGRDRSVLVETSEGLVERVLISELTEVP